MELSTSLLTPSGGGDLLKLKG